MVNGVTRIRIAERVGEIEEAKGKGWGGGEWQKIKPRRNGRPWLGSRMHRVLDRWKRETGRAKKGVE